MSSFEEWLIRCVEKWNRTLRSNGLPHRVDNGLAVGSDDMIDRVVDDYHEYRMHLGSPEHAFGRSYVQNDKYTSLIRRLIQAKHETGQMILDGSLDLPDDDMRLKLIMTVTEMATVIRELNDGLVELIGSIAPEGGSIELPSDVNPDDVFLDIASNLTFIQHILEVANLILDDC